MATSKDRKENGAKVSSFLGFAGGLAIGAAALYGAYKLIKTQFGYDNNKDSNNVESEIESFRTWSKHGGKTGKKLETNEKEENLGDALLRYYNNYVDVSTQDVEDADTVVETFTEILTLFLKNHCPKLRFHQIYKGSSQELHAVEADRYTLMLPLFLDKDIWTVVDGAYTLHNTPEFWLVKRINTEFFEVGNCLWDDCCVGDYLSPVKVRRALRSALQKALIDWTAKYQMSFSLWGQGSNTTALVEYGDSKKLYIELLPLVVTDNVCIVAKPHPHVATNVSFENLWMQSYHDCENRAICDMDKEDSGCRVKCLKICRGVYLNNPALQVVDFEVFITVLFMLNYRQAVWREVDLADRFKDMFQLLESTLRSGYMKSFFGSGRNMIEGYHRSDLENMLCYLNGVISRNKYLLLLKSQQY